MSGGAKSQNLGITHVKTGPYLCTRYGNNNSGKWFVYDSIGLGCKDEYERGGLHVSPPSFLYDNVQFKKQ